MKKLVLPVLLAFWLCSCNVPAIPEKTSVTPEISEISETAAENGGVIRSARDLDAKVAYMCDNFLPSVKVRLRDLDVWSELMDYYKLEKDLLIMRGITKLNMTYNEYAGYINAELTPEYETYMNVIAAYRKKDASGLTDKEREVYDKAAGIIADEVPGSGSTFQKELAVHDYLTGNIVYDSAQSEESFTVYGALIGGRAVCSGYAQAFKTLMNMLNTDCLIVTGTANGDSHAWNLINVGGDWYHVDVTWNDADEFEGTHRYFNVTDDVIKYDHTWNAKNYRSAGQVKYNYYRFTGKEVKTAGELSAAITSAYERGDRAFELVCAYAFSPGDLSFSAKFGECYYSDTPYGDNTFLAVKIKG